MIRLVSLFLLTVVSAFSATFTTISPPAPGEGDTQSIVSLLFPDYIRISDDNDQYFTQASGFFVLAWEDDARGSGDFDYNDLIIHAYFNTGQLVSWYQVAKYSQASQSFGYNQSGFLFDSTGIGTVYSVPSLNSDSLDHMVTWSKSLPPPVSDVPEPAAWVLFGMGLLSVAELRRRKIC